MEPEYAPLEKGKHLQTKPNHQVVAFMLQGSFNGTHSGGMKQCKFMVILGDLPFNMH